MYFYKNLYVGPSIQNPEEVKHKLMIGQGQLTIYVITLSSSRPGPGSNQLEIMHCANLKQPYYKEYPPYIIGIAAGISEAVGIVRDLVQESYEKTGSADVRYYLFPHGVKTNRVQKAKPAAVTGPVEPEAADGSAPAPGQGGGDDNIT